VNQFASIYNLYQKIVNENLAGFTVPAFNIRALAFDTACALFRAAKKEKVGPFIIEIAKSEMEYTNQPPEEFSEVISAAALKENWQGPIFLQADHFKIKKGEGVGGLENLLKRAIAVGFYNIDIDCSALPLKENIEKTNYFIEFIRQNQPVGIIINVGGEVGQIGGANTTVEELDEFLQGVKGISKVAVQTGTSHGKGGQIDWRLLQALSQKAKDFGLAGIVQHGASTLPDREFSKFPQAGVCEIHLATELMDIVLESKDFPRELKEKIKTKNDLGANKEGILSMPQRIRDKISRQLEKKFVFFFKQLNVAGTKKLIQEYSMLS